MPGVLDSILAARRQQTERAKRLHPEAELRQWWQSRCGWAEGAVGWCGPDRQPRPRVDDGRPGQAELVRGDSRFVQSIREHGPLAVVAEVKRRSPSAGPIRPDLDLAAQAQIYTQAGAAAISVLTESAYFAGGPDDLRRAQSVSSLPVLRKDFLTEPYHLYESAYLGADAVLLIARILGDSQLRQLLTLARELGLAALVEVHDETDLNRALTAGATVIGINNRNLDTLRTDLQTVRRLAPLIPPQPDRLVIAESGYHNAADVTDLVELGVNAVLVGEALLKADDPAACLRQLLPPPVQMGTASPAQTAPRPRPRGRGEAEPEDPRRSHQLPQPVQVKICGLSDLEGAIAAAQAGADALGFVFHPGSRHFVPLEQAQRWFPLLRQSLCQLRPLQPLPPLPRLVGVFVDTPLDVVVLHVERLGLDVVQLHGQANLPRLAPLRARLDAVGRHQTQVWWGWPFPDAGPTTEPTDPTEPARPGVDAAWPIEAILVDRAGPSVGGNGLPFRPETLARLGRLRHRWPPLRWGVAGGLRPETVAATIAAAAPDFVDVSSGVEVQGHKDPERMRHFVAAARQAFADPQVQARREVIL